MRTVRIVADARPWRLENDTLLVNSSAAFEVRGERADFVRAQAQKVIQDCSVRFPALARLVATPEALNALNKLIRIAVKEDPNTLGAVLLDK